MGGRVRASIPRLQSTITLVDAAAAGTVAAATPAVHRLGMSAATPVAATSAVHSLGSAAAATPGASEESTPWRDPTSYRSRGNSKKTASESSSGRHRVPADQPRERPKEAAALAATSSAQHSRHAPADQPREQPQEAEAIPAPSPAHVLPLGEVLGVWVSWAEFRTGLSENGYGVCV